MDTRLKSVTFLILLLASLFCFMLSASEARPLQLHYPSSSPGEGHRLKKLQNLGKIKDSGPSPGAGHSFQDLAVTDRSGPSPGQGHKVIINRKHL
ncbi:hypothetical protein L6164_035719 [Bauhinia variegata]|uniref:Uncharacterized protein n=1 Tax=Bauhinia variegata TaxID=167791 RepID=A0ACB9KEU8_BAUVA|nr:hypothetical protein L6164_035719 [Bauhinia variegata]